MGVADTNDDVGNASTKDAPSPAPPVLPTDCVQSPPAAVEHSSADELSSSSLCGSDSDLEPLETALEPEKCSVSGPGLAGAIAGQPARLTITARDAAGNVLSAGHGAHVVVYVERPFSEKKESDAYVAVDNGNGTYTAMYTLPAKGNYEIRIEINGQQAGGSPFPVYCDNAQDNVSDAGGKAVTSITCTSKMSLGAQAGSLGVDFNGKDKATLRRTILVSSPHLLTEESLRTIFAMYGKIRSITFPATTSVGGKPATLIEYNMDNEADAALKMAGISLQGNVLNVENALQASMQASMEASHGVAERFSISKESVLANAAQRARRLAMGIHSDRTKRSRSRSRSKSRERERDGNGNGNGNGRGGTREKSGGSVRAKEEARQQKKKKDVDAVEELDALLEEIEAAR